MAKLHVDFESQSKICLKSRGLGPYAEDESTDFTIMAWAFDDEPVEILHRIFDTALPERIVNHVKNGGEIVAHNANFELNLWNKVCAPRYGWPMLSPSQMNCTMARCFAMALPGSLEKAAVALDLQFKKDMKGSRAMLAFAVPDPRTGEFRNPADDLEKYNLMVEYCKADLEVERELDKRLFKLTDKEKQIWLLDQEINERGLEIDVYAASKAAKISESEKEKLDKKMREVTENAVATCNAVKQITDFLRDNGANDIEGIAKNDILDALKDDSLSEVCKTVLNLRRDAAKSSTAKLESMLKRVNKANRIQNTLQYHGAATGRWAGRGIQIQNFPRGEHDEQDIENFFDCLKTDTPLELFFDKPLSIISSSLRGFIIPKAGAEFVGADFSSIEARVLAWLAGEDKVLDIFRGHGKIYEAAASEIYKVPLENIDKKQRQIGKVAVLALGYGGGKGAFKSMAAAYGVEVSDEDAELIKTKWRDAHRRIVNYWYALETAAQAAVRNKKKVFSVGPENRQVKYVCNGSFLWCQLPSGRSLCYPYPEIREVETPWGEKKEGLTYMTEAPPTNKWGRIKTYGGSLSENIAQAVSRDVLADAMLRLKENNFSIVATIHDEILCEVGDNSNNSNLVETLEALLAVSPEWAIDLPLKAEGWKGKRYKK